MRLPDVPDGLLALQQLRPPYDFAEQLEIERPTLYKVVEGCSFATPQLLGMDIETQEAQDLASVVFIMMMVVLEILNEGGVWDTAPE